MVSIKWFLILILLTSPVYADNYTYYSTIGCKCDCVDINRSDESNFLKNTNPTLTKILTYGIIIILIIAIIYLIYAIKSNNGKDNEKLQGKNGRRRLFSAILQR